MKRILKILLFISALFLVFLSFVLYKVFWDPENTKQVYYPISKQEKGLLRSGDIILRRGYGMFSDALIKVQEAKYPVSHCAMVLRDSKDIRVMHSLSSSVSSIDGAQFQSLQRFLNESVPNTILVVRLKSGTDTIMSIANRMKGYANKHVPFDHEFDRQDTSKFYCTELFQHCFELELNKDIFAEQDLDKTNGVYGLSTFLDTNYFEPIINHHLREQ